MSVAGLVLAAGEGRRFGGPKALAVLDGERLVDRIVGVAAAAGLDPIHVVSGAAPLELTPPTVVVPNPLWHTGMGSSLRAGLASLEATGVAAAVVLLVDTPWLSPHAVQRLVSSAGASPAAIATYDGRRGHPVLLAASTWSQVAALAVGDVAAKAWLRAHPDQVREVDCTGLGDPRDVDRPQDLAAPP